MTACEYYLPGNAGIANNVLVDNNTFTGINNIAWYFIIHFQNHLNATITNNMLVNIQWPFHNAFMFEQFTSSCPKEPATKIIIENNTLTNTDVRRSSFISFVLSLSESGQSEVHFKNNYIDNVILKEPGILKVIKPGLRKVSIEIVNFTVSRSVITGLASPCI